MQLTFKANLNNGRHGWLRLTPAYSWQLVKHLIDNTEIRNEGTVILDPFCGSGTTALLCAQHGIRCDAVDINPFLVWLANVKCALYREQDIQLAESLSDSLLEAAPRDNHSCWAPPIRDIHKWWTPQTLEALSWLFENLQTVEEEPARNLLKVAFCQVIIETALVSFGHQSLSFRKLPMQPIHASVTQQTRQYVINLFRQHVKTITLSARQHVYQTARIIRGDARYLSQILPLKRYTMVITSPPYPNRMSYIRELRPYMYWLGFLKDSRQAGEMDWESIGGTWGRATSMLMKWKPNPSLAIPWPGFKQIVSRIRARSELLARYLEKYFEDVLLHLESILAVTKPGARVFYVVGNSKFYDTLVPVEQIYAQLLAEVGFTNVSVHVLRKRSSKRELYEYLVCANKAES